MSGRVIAVSGEASLSVRNRNLVVRKEGAEVGKLPLEEIGVLVVEDAQAVITQAVLAGCAEHGAAVVVCDGRHLPSGVLLPLEGHTLHTKTLREQIACGRPARKQTWRRIVQAKLRAQGECLRRHDRAEGARQLLALSALVRSGDPDNVEARGAALHFEWLFGPAFMRDRDAAGLNALLNYGYAVLRACVARAVVGAGLHPALGVHHQNQYNPLCLADDAMEPLRPLVDSRVADLIEREGPDVGMNGLTPSLKRELVGVTQATIRFGGRPYALLVGLERYAASLRRAVCEGAELTTPEWEAPRLPGTEPTGELEERG